jgi:hypothetical protein
VAAQQPGIDIPGDALSWLREQADRESEQARGVNVNLLGVAPLPLPVEHVQMVGRGLRSKNEA